MKKLWVLLVTLLVMTTSGWLLSMVDVNSGTLYWILEVANIGSIITIVIVSLSFVTEPIWNASHQIRLKRMKHKNNLLEEKTRHQHEMSKYTPKVEEEK